jgi:hypothetical protein
VSLADESSKKKMRELEGSNKEKKKHKHFFYFAQNAIKTKEYTQIAIK